jgi:hypothetical protein
MWAKLDDAILDNPKIIAVGPLGFALHVAAITWCARNLTDGLIPKRRVGQLLDLPSLQVSETTKVRVLQALTADDLATELERLRLWHDRGDAWEVHDYLVYNPSRAQVLAEREATRKRVATHRNREKNRGNAVTNAPVTVHPVPVPVPGSGSRTDLSVAPRARRATQWPEDFTLTLERAEVARTLRVDAAAEWAKFKDHALKDGATHKNWDAAWRYWCRRAPDFQRRRLL